MENEELNKATDFLMDKLQDVRKEIVVMLMEQWEKHGKPKEFSLWLLNQSYARGIGFVDNTIDKDNKKISAYDTETELVPILYDAYRAICTRAARYLLKKDKEMMNAVLKDLTRLAIRFKKPQAILK